MCQFSGTVLQTRQKGVTKQAEINLSGHFLHSCFELTRTEIHKGRVEGYLTFASQIESVSPHGRFISPVKSLEGEQSTERKMHTGCKLITTNKKNTRGCALAPCNNVKIL